MRNCYIAMGYPVLDESGGTLEPVALMVAEDEASLVQFIDSIANPHPTPSRIEANVPLDSYVYDGWCFQSVEVVGPVPVMFSSVSLNEVGRGQGVSTSKAQVLRLTRECTELVHVALHRPDGSNLLGEMVDVVFAVAALAAQEGVDLDAAVTARMPDGTGVS